VIYRTLLIDDEPLALERLERLLRPHAALVQIIGRESAGQAAVAAINRLRPGLVFLDIQMPELDGFQVLDRLEHLPWIIFCTAYDQYALSAFETCAIDYLLKPVSAERLEKAMAKVQRLTTADHTALQDQFQALLRHLQAPGRQRLQVRQGDRVRFVDVADICFLRTANKYVEGRTRQGTFLLDQSLNQLEAQLPQGDFVRVHRSALVNLNHVAEIVRRLGACVVRMQDGTELPVSRSARSRLGL
jgi:two-component system LytT family response regulator